MTRTAEMGMAEPYDGLVIILVPGAIFIDIGVVFPVLLIGDRIGIRAQLDHPEGRSSAWIDMTHARGADDRADILQQVLACNGVACGGLLAPFVIQQRCKISADDAAGLKTHLFPIGSLMPVAQRYTRRPGRQVMVDG